MLPEETTAQSEIWDFLRVVNRRKLTIILVTVATVAIVLVLSAAQTKQYKATARVFLRGSEAVFDQNRTTDPAAIKTELELVKSEPVKALVREKLGQVPGVSAAQVGETNVIDVSVVTDDPKQSAHIADAYAASYVEVSRRQAISTLVAATDQLGSKINGLRGEIEAIDRQIAVTPTGSPVLQSLSSQRSALVTQQTTFKQKLDQLQVDTSLKTGGGQLVSPAAVPGSPVSPQPRRNGAVAGVLGLLLGIGLAYVRDHFDDTIKTKDDLERTLPGVPVLGIIPALRGRESSVALADGHTPAAEAYRSLRTSIQFRSIDRPIRTLLVTSPRLGDGKSTTVANLGVAFARAGLRVTIVSCDMRRPKVHEYYGLTATKGFTSVLLGEIPLSAAIQEVPEEKRLQLVASGPIPPNPSELLSSPRTDEVLNSLLTNSDVVLLDSPPLLPVADAAALAGRVDGVLMLVRAGKTTKRELHRAVELLNQVGATVVGTVFAGAGREGRARYYYADYKAGDSTGLSAAPFPVGAGSLRSDHGSGDERRLAGTEPVAWTRRFSPRARR